MNDDCWSSCILFLCNDMFFLDEYEQRDIFNMNDKLMLKIIYKRN